MIFLFGIRHVPSSIKKIKIVCGGIAQLGERLNGIQEVSGSIPLISTTKNRMNSAFVRFLFFQMPKRFLTLSNTC